MKVKKLLSLCLTLLITLGMISPAAAAIATAAETLSPEEYKIYHSIGPGDVANLSSYGLDTPEAIDEYLDTLEDLGINRIYWRGLELSIITNQLKVRP